MGKLGGGSSGLGGRASSQFSSHERVMMTACIVSLGRDSLKAPEPSGSSSSSSAFRVFYGDYLGFKSSFMCWRGRANWFDFHRTLFSHFIWLFDFFLYVF